MKRYIALVLILASVCVAKVASAVICDLISEGGIDHVDCDWDGIPDYRDNCEDVKNGNCALDREHCDINGDCSVLNPLPGCVTEEEIQGGNQADWNDNDIGDACEDTDSEGILDYIDNCPAAANLDQLDTDLNGKGDACTDTDNDSYSDAIDNCVETYNSQQIDTDSDTLGDACDNCFLVANIDQLDTDFDGRGNACEDDFDGDGIIDMDDNCVETQNADQADGDGDMVGDACDNCPAVLNSEQADSDGDNVGDACEIIPAVVPVEPPPEQPVPEDGILLQGSGGVTEGGCQMTGGETAATVPMVLGFLFLATSFVIMLRRARS